MELSTNETLALQKWLREKAEKDDKYRLEHPQEAFKLEKWRIENPQEAATKDRNDNDRAIRWLKDHPREVERLSAEERERIASLSMTDQEKRVLRERRNAERIAAWEREHPEEVAERQRQAELFEKARLKELKKAYRAFLTKVASDSTSTPIGHPFAEIKWVPGQRTPRCRLCNKKCRDSVWIDFEFCCWKHIHEFSVIPGNKF
jgi:hypothetical protein